MVIEINNINQISDFTLGAHDEPRRAKRQFYLREVNKSLAARWKNAGTFPHRGSVEVSVEV